MAVWRLRNHHRGVDALCKSHCIPSPCIPTICTPPAALPSTSTYSIAPFPALRSPQLIHLRNALLELHILALLVAMSLVLHPKQSASVNTNPLSLVKRPRPTPRSPSNSLLPQCSSNHPRPGQMRYSPHTSKANNKSQIDTDSAE